MTWLADLRTVVAMSTNASTATRNTRDIPWPPPRPYEVHSVPRSSWAGWTLTTIASIWTAVVVISVFAPDLVSGSEQQHLPIAAFSTWLWGMGATIASLIGLSRLRGDERRRPLWIALSGATMAIWTVATGVSLFAPEMVTGTDPTTIPLGAMIAPVAAMVLTALASAVLATAELISRPR